MHIARIVAVACNTTHKYKRTNSWLVCTNKVHYSSVLLNIQCYVFILFNCTYKEAMFSAWCVTAQINIRLHYDTVWFLCLFIFLFMHLRFYCHHFCNNTIFMEPLNCNRWMGDNTTCIDALFSAHFSLSIRFMCTYFLHLSNSNVVKISS